MCVCVCVSVCMCMSNVYVSVHVFACLVLPPLLTSHTHHHAPARPCTLLPPSVRTFVHPCPLHTPLFVRFSIRAPLYTPLFVRLSIRVPCTRPCSYVCPSVSLVHAPVRTFVPSVYPSTPLCSYVCPGIIMAIAFSGLLFSRISALNQLAFYLVFAVLFDTFVGGCVGIQHVCSF